MKKERKTDVSLFEKSKFLAYEFFRKNSEMKALQKQLEVLKKNFYNSISMFFEENDIESEVSFSYNEIAANTVLKIKKTQKVSVEFDAEKTEKAVGKELSKVVISKSYEIDDMQGLVTYLKSCGVDPKKFKSYIKVKKTVNISALENLVATGKVVEAELDGCYNTNKSKPYFTVTAKKGQGKDD